MIVLAFCVAALLAISFALLVHRDRYRGVGVIAISKVIDPRCPPGKVFFLDTRILELPPPPEFVPHFRRFARDDPYTDTWVIDHLRITGNQMAAGIIKGIT